MITFDKKLLRLSVREIHIKNSDLLKFALDSDLISLTESIFENGILKPLIVRKVSLRGYELVSGFRRFLVAKRLNLRRVPCIVCTADDKEAALIRLNDNLCRFIPSYLESAKEIECAMQTYNMSCEEIAAKLGLSRSEALKKLGILKLDNDILSRLDAEGLDENYAALLINTPPKLRQNALDIIIAEKLSIKQAENLIHSMRFPKNTAIKDKEQADFQKEKVSFEETKSVPPPVKVSIGDVRLFSNSLSRLVETMKNAGVKVKSTTLETKKYTEYKVRIEKETAHESCAQLEMSLR